jgi:molecular chaperone GrpE
MNSDELKNTNEDLEPEVPEVSEEERDPSRGDGGEGEEPQELGDEVDAIMNEVEALLSQDAPEEAQKDEKELLQDELNALKDQHLRLAADFENYRKRVNADLAAGWARAQAELAGSLLEGLDDLQRVSQFTTEDATLETLIEGVDLVERKLLKALNAAGLEVQDPTGEIFDPNIMEAMMRVPTEDDGQDGTVHQVFQKGYTLKGQLVRPARVSVYRDDD